MKKILEHPTIKKHSGKIKKFLAVFFIFLVWVLVGWPKIDFYIGNFHFRFPPDIWGVEAATGVQHEYAWGLDKSATSTMGSRSNTGNDVRISIKAGASAGSDTDPILRLQIVNTGALVIGDTVTLYFTDCTGGVLKTCFARSKGTDPATQMVPVEPQGATAGQLFRMREANNAAVVGGDQISGVVGVTEHNPVPGIYVEGSTTISSSTSAINTAAYPAVDFSFEYYGVAPVSLKTYVFANAYNEVLPGASGMHGSTGALLDILPANWTGSAIAQEGVAITSNTSATATIYFTDDSNRNSTSSISYSTLESGPYTTPAGCDSLTAGYNSSTLQDGSLNHERSCDITGLTANKIYFVKIIHNDTDGISGDATTVLGPFYTDQTKGAVHMHVDTGDTASTTDDINDMKEDDAGAFVNTAAGLAVGDGQLTLLRSTGRFQVDTWTPGIPAGATLNSTELRYQYGTSANEARAQKLFRATAGTEPALCSNVYGSEGGTNWNLVATMPATSTTWYTEATTTLTGYTIQQLVDLDLCMSNTNNSGGANSDIVGFDFLSIIPIFTPTTTGSGAPYAITDAATLITSGGAQLNGRINTQGISGMEFFEYGPTASYGSYLPDSMGHYTFNSVFAHSVGAQAHWHEVTGLEPNTTYHFRSCLMAPPSAPAVCGSDATFTTTVTPSAKKSIIFFD